MEGTPQDDALPVMEPRCGLEFETKEEAYAFYRDYARLVGFSVTIKASRRSKISRKFIDVKVACSRYGAKRENVAVVHPRPCMRTGCKAGMHMKRRGDGRWVIHDFVKEHNHETCADDCYNAGQGRSKALGPEPCGKKGMQLILGEDDARTMMEFLMQMQGESPNFFYAVDLCPERSMRCVFWVDQKGRHDYGTFCDVVLIDSFYVKERYRVPLVTVVGVNQHMQYSLLGCALIGEETSATYVWVMKTWLRAMLGRSPKVVLTDLDECLKEAVAAVFPDSHHCFGLWHVYEKIPKYLGHVLSKHPDFVNHFNECVHWSETVDEFENRWRDFVSRFNMHSEEWVISLNRDRERWVPAYMLGSFLGGMSTSERKGSITAFFDKYMEKKSSFEEFIERYNAYMIDRYLLEAEAGNDMECKESSVLCTSLFEWQMSEIYTHTVFKKFQSEVLAVASCNLQRAMENDAANVIFRVGDSGGCQKFSVSWKAADHEISCSCRSFEYRGFLCRHAILVLQSSGVHCIPNQYILKRWTRNAKSKRTISDKCRALHTHAARFNDLCRLAVDLGEEGSLSKEAYDIAHQALEEVLRHCIAINTSTGSISVSSSLASHGVVDAREDSAGNLSSKSPNTRKTLRKRKGDLGPEDSPIQSLHKACRTDS